MSVWSSLHVDTPDRAEHRRRRDLDHDVVTVLAVLAILAFTALAILVSR
jgi:hypothetical protein